MTTDPRVERLTAAAHRRSTEKVNAAKAAISRLRKAGRPVNFLSVGKEAGVSHSFLYSHPDLRTQIEHLRRAPRISTNAEPASSRSSDGNLVIVLTQQIGDLKHRHRDEVNALKEAVAKAHGENLALRRQLAQRGLTPSTD